MEIFRRKLMYYLADFKRRYEKELDKLPATTILDKNKGIGRGLRESFMLEGGDKKGKVGTIRERIKGFRNNIGNSLDPIVLRQVTGGAKTSENLSTPQQRLRYKRDKLRYIRERQLKEDAKYPYQLLSQKPEYKQKKARKVRVKKGGQIFQKRNKIIKTPPTTQPSPTTQKVITTASSPSAQASTSKKITSNLGRKVAIGAGVATLGLGGLYALNKMRKTRSDKGKTRGRYK